VKYKNKTFLFLCLFILSGYLFLEIKTFKEMYQLEAERGDQLLETVGKLEEKVDFLNKEIEEVKILFFIEKLKDREFISIYGEGIHGI